MTRRPPLRSPDAAVRSRRRYAPRLAAAQRREQLLDAALEVILELGYSGISIEAVARVAGVTRPVVYDHFENLGQLLQTLIEREERYALAQLEDVVPNERAGADPADALATGVRRFLEAVTCRPATWRIILLSSEGTPAAVRQHIDANRQQMLERIEDLTRRAMADPLLDDQVDAELTARALRDLGEEAGRLVLGDPERYSPERYERFARRLLKLLWPAART